MGCRDVQVLALRVEGSGNPRVTNGLGNLLLKELDVNGPAKGMYYFT